MVFTVDQRSSTTVHYSLSPLDQRPCCCWDLAIFIPLCFFFILFLLQSGQYWRIGACGFFIKVDSPMCTQARDVIPGLLRRTIVLQEQLQIQRARERRLLCDFLGAVLLVDH